MGLHQALEPERQSPLARESMLSTGGAERLTAQEAWVFDYEN
jgi:hypothetical protein